MGVAAVDEERSGRQPEDEEEGDVGVWIDGNWEQLEEEEVDASKAHGHQRDGLSKIREG